MNEVGIFVAQVVNNSFNFFVITSFDSFAYDFLKPAAEVGSESILPR